MASHAHTCTRAHRVTHTHTHTHTHARTHTHTHLSSTLVVDELEEARALCYGPDHHKVVSADGTLFKPNGTFTGVRARVCAVCVFVCACVCLCCVCAGRCVGRRHRPLSCLRGCKARTRPAVAQPSPPAPHPPRATHATPTPPQRAPSHTPLCTLTGGRSANIDARANRWDAQEHEALKAERERLRGEIDVSGVAGVAIVCVCMRDSVCVCVCVCVCVRVVDACAEASLGHWARRECVCV
jgi:hypothetical protein